MLGACGCATSHSVHGEGVTSFLMNTLSGHPVCRPRLRCCHPSSIRSSSPHHRALHAPACERGAQRRSGAQARSDLELGLLHIIEGIPHTNTSIVTAASNSCRETVPQVVCAPAVQKKCGVLLCGFCFCCSFFIYTRISGRGARPAFVLILGLTECPWQWLTLPPCALLQPSASMQLQALPRHRLTGPSAGVPYYMQSSITSWGQLVASMPPQLQRSVHGALDQSMQGTHMWEPGQPTLWSLRAAVRQLLDSIGNVLQDIALLVSADGRSGGEAARFAAGHAALGTPLGRVPLLDQCMVPDAALVRGTPHINFDEGGYLLLAVARRAPSLGGWLHERAHRVVLWAFFGPPPAGLRRPCVMHVCHNPMCCSVDHLVWGEDRENWQRRDLADEAARRRLQQQGRPVIL